MRKPSQLLIAERAHAARFEIGDVDKADAMHAAGVKRVPAGALRVLAVTFEIGLAVFLVDEIVLARHIMDIELGFADDFLRIVELPWLRKMGDVAGVDHEGGLDRKAVHLIDRFLQGPKRIGIGRLVETYMAIRNLQEAEARGGFFCRLSRAHAEKLRGFGDASSDGPDDAGPGPDHAFERAAPVDPCALLVVRHFWSPWAGALARCYGGDFAARLFIPGALRISRGSVQVFMALSYTYRATRDGCEAHLLICRPRKILTAPDFRLVRCTRRSLRYVARIFGANGTGTQTFAYPRADGANDWFLPENLSHQAGIPGDLCDTRVLHGAGATAIPAYVEVVCVEFPDK